jgi:hypothetical protein
MGRKERKEGKKERKKREKGVIAENLVHCTLLPVALNRHLAYIFCVLQNFTGS